MAGTTRGIWGQTLKNLPGWQAEVEKYGGITAGAGGMYETPADVNKIWEEDYEAVVGEAAAAGKTETQNILERELARLRMRMGYSQSAGAGTGGRWELARSGMLSAGAQEQMRISDAWKRWEAEQHLGFLNIKDQQRYGLTMAANQAYYQQEALKLQAELNDPTWWQTFGSIVGMGLGLWVGGPAGAAIGGGVGTAIGGQAGGGIVGGGVGGGWSAAGGIKYD